MDKDFSSEYEKTNDLIISKKNIEIEGQTYQFQFLDKDIIYEDSVSSERAKKGIILLPIRSLLPASVRDGRKI